MHRHVHDTVMRLAGRALAFLLRRGLRLGPMMLLTVRGRRTGEPRTNPVDLFERDDRRWLVSTHGAGDANWVRNLRAAGECTLARGREQFSFAASELAPLDAARVLREVLGPRLARPVAGYVLRRTLDLDADSPVDAFEKAAPMHPVFELTGPA